MTYLLNINKTQAKTISHALDFFSRIVGAKFDVILESISWEKRDNLEKVSEMLLDIKQLLTNLSRNATYGIGKVSEEAKIAYDLHQVIRHQLAWDEKPEGDITIDFDTPRKVSQQDLATINKKSEKKRNQIK